MALIQIKKRVVLNCGKHSGMAFDFQNIFLYTFSPNGLRVTMITCLSGVVLDNCRGAGDKFFKLLSCGLNLNFYNISKLYRLKLTSLFSNNMKIIIQNFSYVIYIFRDSRVFICQKNCFGRKTDKQI